MWQRQNTWIHYVKNIIAADIASAIFLASYIRRCHMSKSYVACLEVADLQTYKLIKRKDKVRAALGAKAGTPFVFVLGKN